MKTQKYIKTILFFLILNLSLFSVFAEYPQFLSDDIKSNSDLTYPVRTFNYANGTVYGISFLDISYSASFYSAPVTGDIDNDSVKEFMYVDDSTLYIGEVQIDAFNNPLYFVEHQVTYSGVISSLLTYTDSGYIIFQTRTGMYSSYYNGTAYVDRLNSSIGCGTASCQYLKNKVCDDDYCYYIEPDVFNAATLTFFSIYDIANNSRIRYTFASDFPATITTNSRIMDIAQPFLKDLDNDGYLDYGIVVDLAGSTCGVTANQNPGLMIIEVNGTSLPTLNSNFFTGGLICELSTEDVRLPEYMSDVIPINYNGGFYEFAYVRYEDNLFEDDIAVYSELQASGTILEYPFLYESDYEITNPVFSHLSSMFYLGRQNLCGFISNKTTTGSTRDFCYDIRTKSDTFINTKSEDVLDSVKDESMSFHSFDLAGQSVFFPYVLPFYSNDMEAVAITSNIKSRFYNSAFMNLSGAYMLFADNIIDTDKLTQIIVSDDTIRIIYSTREVTDSNVSLFSYTPPSPVCLNQLIDLRFSSQGNIQNYTYTCYENETVTVHPADLDALNRFNVNCYANRTGMIIPELYYYTTDSIRVNVSLSLEFNVVNSYPPSCNTKDSIVVTPDDSTDVKSRIKAWLDSTGIFAGYYGYIYFSLLIFCITIVFFIFAMATMPEIGGTLIYFAILSVLFQVIFFTAMDLLPFFFLGSLIMFSLALIIFKATLFRN